MFQNESSPNFKEYLFGPDIYTFLKQIRNNYQKIIILLLKINALNADLNDLLFMMMNDLNPSPIQIAFRW